MEKNRLHLIVLIFLLLVLVNYVIYNSFLKEDLSNFKALKEEYLAKEERIKSINNEKALIPALKGEVEKLKLQSNYKDSIELSYMFYNLCIEFQIAGSDLVFQNSNNDASREKFEEVDITLRTRGNKINMSNFIKNLDSRIGSTLRVKSIALTEMDEDILDSEIVFRWQGEFSSAM